jgi:ABC-type uncharacterized transport system ATPase subunit
MTVLSVEHVSKSFGGLRAVNDVSLQLERGEMRGLIGSNGAGKSTLLHLIYGQCAVDLGTIRFRGVDVTWTPASHRARAGMGLVFQVASVFAGLTVEENLLLGAIPKSRRDGAGDDTERMERVLDLIELRNVRNRRASELSHGERQWLEIGMVLLTEPSLLLLDEPTSGMTASESRRTATLLRDIQARDAVDAMIIVEHNIEFIGLVSDVVTVMHRGRILASGTVTDIQANGEVQAAYLGRLQ